jgi:hypothetical protein
MTTFVKIWFKQAHSDNDVPLYINVEDIGAFGLNPENDEQTVLTLRSLPNQPAFSDMLLRELVDLLTEANCRVVNP